MHQMTKPTNQALKCSAILLAKIWQKATGSKHIHLLSREVEAVFMEKLQPNNKTSDVETRQSKSSMHKNKGTTVQKNGSRSSGLTSPNLKHLTEEKGS